MLSSVRGFGNAHHPIAASRIVLGSPQYSESARGVIEKFFPTTCLTRSREHSKLRLGPYAPSPSRILIVSAALMVLALMPFTISGYATSQSLGELVQIVGGVGAVLLFLSVSLYEMYTDKTHRHLAMGRYLPFRPYSLLMLSTSSAGEWDWQSQLLHEFCHRVQA